MKKIVLLAFSVVLSVFAASAQISQSERNQLTPDQRAIYDRQCKELTEAIKSADYDIFKAEDIIKMGEEMKRDDDGAASSAGAAHVFRGMELRDKARKAKKAAEEALRLLDEAAREAIKKNKKQ